MQIDDFIKNNNILIIGCPGSGKTKLSEFFKRYKGVIHTDDFIKDGFENGLNVLMSRLSGKKTIVEGIMGYRLLRHGLATGKYLPDLVINITASDDTLKKIYQERGKDLSAIASFNKGNHTILSEYLQNVGSDKPMWIDIKNPYQWK